MIEGFITLHRRILDWEWYDNIPTKVLFIHCLLKANHKPNNWRGFDIKRGQFITSIKKISEETGLTTKQVITALKKLEKTNELGKQTTSVNTLITVINYDIYQSEGKPKANQGQTKDKPRATNNNDNNDNKVLESPKSDLEFILDEWAQYRKQKNKALSELSITKLKNEFKNHSIEKIRFVVDLSISNGWQGLFWDKYVEPLAQSKDLRITDPDRDHYEYIMKQVEIAKSFEQ